MEIKISFCIFQGCLNMNDIHIYASKYIYP